MKKNNYLATLILSLIALCGAIRMNAQDTIELRNGMQVIGSVLEISATEVKYKKAVNPEGPTYSELKNNITRIAYKNGTKEEFQFEKPWLQAEEKSEFKPVAQKKFTEMKQIGSKYWYGEKTLNESEMQDVLLLMNNPKITSHVKLAKKQRGWQYIGFAAFPFGIASLYFLSENSGGLFSKYNTPYDKQYENNAKLTALLGLACITTSITLKVKRTKNNKQALKLYQENY